MLRLKFKNPFKREHKNTNHITMKCIFFCREMRNIGNELTQEFLRNVASITSGYLGEEEATVALEEYMLRGIGWRLLFVIDRIGVQVSLRQDKDVKIIHRSNISFFPMYLLPLLK